MSTKTSTSPEELAYAAGIMDGEGTIVLTNPPGRADRKIARLRAPLVAVASRDRELVDWLRCRFGGHISKVKKQKDHWSQTYLWRISNKKALEFLAAVRPYLVIERRIVKADIVLNQYPECAKQGVRPDESMMKKREKFVEDFLAA